MKFETQTIVLTLLLSLGMFASNITHAEEVGEIKYSRGAVTVQKPDGSDARLVGKGDTLNKDEVLKTGSKSFVILQLKDDTKMTLRPGTVFAVEEYTAEHDSKANAVLRLFRGGLRAITGFISKMNPNAYHIKTPTVTIGIRGTEFDARLCEDDCAEENKNLDEQFETDAARTVAKIVSLQGEASAKDMLDNSRPLTLMSPIYEGDTIITGKNASAVLVFRDKSRISLQENTQFRIDALQFAETTRETGVSALFSLLRGGLRTVTGLIGKLHPDKYQIRTSITTIGIRGTGYDLLCTGPCASGDINAEPGMPEGGGLYANVWKGEILLGKQVIKSGQAAFTDNKLGAVKILPAIPEYFINNPVPRPDTIKVDESKLFQARASEPAPKGLYVSVTKGTVVLQSDATQNSVAITKGQAAFSDATGKLVQQLQAIPMFQQFDAYPTPDRLSSAGVDMNSKIQKNLGNDGKICEVK